MTEERRYGHGTLSMLKRSASEGQHSLPEKPCHTRPSEITPKRIYAYKTLNGGQEGTNYRSVNDFPDRVWGSVKTTRFGGEEMVDCTPEYWHSGEFWNRDSLIKKWKEHEVRRQAAQNAHDVHRHDQIPMLKLVGSDRPSISGLLSSDSSFLEAWGFSLGLRDRHGNPTPLWRPITKINQFRSHANYMNQIENHRTNKIPRPERNSFFRSISSHQPGAGDPDVVEGLQYGSTSCEGWDAWEHSCKREGAKTSLGIHGQQHMDHSWGIPHDKLEVRPAGIYSRKRVEGVWS